MISQLSFIQRCLTYIFLTAKSSHVGGIGVTVLQQGLGLDGMV